MSNSCSSTPSRLITRPEFNPIPGLGSAGLVKAAKPFAASSAANLSRRKGRSSQSAYRFHLFGVVFIVRFSSNPAGYCHAYAMIATRTDKILKIGKTIPLLLCANSRALCQRMSKNLRKIKSDWPKHNLDTRRRQ